MEWIWVRLIREQEAVEGDLEEELSESLGEFVNLLRLLLIGFVVLLCVAS